MPDATVVLQLPYPVEADANDYPVYIQQLAERVAAVLNTGFESLTTGQRDALTAGQRPTGRTIRNVTTNRWERYNGASWVPVSDDLLLRGYSEAAVVNAAATGAVSLDLSAGTLFDLTLTGNLTLSFANAAAGRAVSFSVLLRQDGTGGRTVTWPAGVKWPQGVAPTISTSASKVDLITFLRDSAGTWWGFESGYDMR